MVIKRPTRKPISGCSEFRFWILGLIEMNPIEKLMTLLAELEKEGCEFQEGLEIERAFRMLAMCIQAKDILTDLICKMSAMEMPCI